MKKLILILVLLLTSFSAFTQTNPFLSNNNKIQNKSILKNKTNNSALISYISKQQKKINILITKNMRDIKSGKNSLKLFLILILAFLYGMLHALGPGHRKTVIVSYFLSNKGTIKKGILSGFSLSALHAGSSIIIISILYFILKKSLMTSFNNFNFQLEKISYLLICLTGLILLTSKLIELFKNDNHENLSSKKLLAIIISSGMVPCPGAAIILIFSISQHIFLTGILTVIFMSLGMGIIISIFAVITIISKSKLLKTKLFEDKHKLITNIIEIIASLLILVFGLLMLLPYL